MYKQSEIQLGKFGTGFNEFSLKTAELEWQKIKLWSLENNQPVSKFKNHLIKKIEKETHTLKETIDKILSEGLDVNPFTHQTYKTNCIIEC